MRESYKEGGWRRGRVREQRDGVEAMLALAVLACNVAGSVQVLAGRVRARSMATENTMDEPDAQRLALGCLCNCIVKSSIEAVPMSFERTRTGANAVADAGKTASGSAGDPAGRPDRLECSCSAKPSGARTHLPAPRKRLTRLGSRS